ncbi:MAG TPA: transporter [Gemmatimonadaceae bacterium]|nr:transporter [Gemmatimonadaceae bacterium]
MRARALASLVLGCVTLSSVARAQNPDSASAPADPHAAQPERPTVATHAGTVAPGWVEIEAGVEHDDLHGAHALLTPTVLKFGIAPRLQIELIGSFQHFSGTIPDYSGIGDIGAALKWRVLEHAPVVGDLALQPSLKFPTGSAVHGTGTGTTDVGLLLISSHDWGGYALDINAGYTRRSGDGSRAPKDATLWTVSSGGPVYKRLGWVAEFYGLPRTTGPAGEEGIVAFLTGPTVEVEKWLVFDAGAIFPLTGAQPHALYAGLTWNIGKL